MNGESQPVAGRRWRARRALISILACAALVLVAATPASARPDCGGGYFGVPGQRVKAPDSSAVHLVDPDGYRRWIPSADAYNYLFRSWSGIVVTDVRCMHQRPPLANPNGNLVHLLKGYETPYVYLIVDGTKRWVISPAVMDKYHFDWSKVYKYPDAWMDDIPTGPVWH